MAIKTAGTLAISEISAEFGGSGDLPLSSYYAGGGLVPAGTVGYPASVSTPIPTSGRISISNFYGATALVASLTPASQNLSFTKGTGFQTQNLTAVNFVGTVTYSVSPNLPSGLNFNTTNGIIAGMVNQVQPATVYTITGTGSTSGSATATVSLAITAPVPTITPASQVIAAHKYSGFATQGLTTQNFVGTVTYSVSPNLPNGFRLNTTNGIISGSTSSALPTTIYTVTATGSISGSATATISITVS